jgi:hypothetical protein
MENTLSTSVKKIFFGVLIFVIAGLIYSVTDHTFALLIVWLKILNYVALGGIIVGYVFTFIGLSGFKNAAQNDADKKSIGLVRTAYILLVLSAGIDFIPLMGWVAGILSLISAIVLLMGYSKLRKSVVFNRKMLGGFSILFIAAILILVGEGLDFIPLVGNILWAIFNFVGLVVTLIGWNKVKGGAVRA